MLKGIDKKTGHKKKTIHRKYDTNKYCKTFTNKNIFIKKQMSKTN